MSEADPKAINLIRGIWFGKESTGCDGNMYGFSRLMHVLFSTPIKRTDMKPAYIQLATNDFAKMDETVDYTFQYRYRVKDISMFYYKELFSACFLLLFFFNQMNAYMANFKGP
jgi:hypothetical protein